jgi:DNA modification methylase
MELLKNESIDLVVTSPPYPMIEMWDDILSAQNADIRTALACKDARRAFELMHQELERVWNECWRVLKEGAFLCVNIGDATRTIDGNFALYNNSARIIQSCEGLGFINLPNILWRKTTNAPNKFMGSGMLPCGAYVTLEHEWILVFRKSGKRVYKNEHEKAARRDSSFFWEERNSWFSDLWEIKGVRQTIENTTTRERNASFPLEIPYRLINMYSQKGDTVLDPFMGLGTTVMASMLSERNSVGFEIDPLLKPLLRGILGSVSVTKANALIHERYQRHLAFVQERIASGKEVKYFNDKINAPVMTAQETDLTLHYLREVLLKDDASNLSFESTYDLETNLAEVPFYEKGTLFG